MSEAKRHRSGLSPLAVVATAASMSISCLPARAASFIEKAIAEANPCQGNKVNVLGTTIGIDKFDRVEIKDFSVIGKGGEGQASVTGFLSCKTSDQAAAPGDANAEFTATASIDLNSCAIKSKSVDITKTGGKYKLLVDVLKGRIIDAVEGSIVSEAKKLCK